VEEKKLASFLKQSLAVLKDFFPLGSVALVPVVYSSLLWALNRKAELNQKIQETRVWLLPESLKNKPDDFVLDFFQRNQELAADFAGQIEKKDLKRLRPAFKALYPILGLEDPFLEKLFSGELSSNNYRQVVVDFEPRLNRALSEIEAARLKPGFWETLKKITSEFVSLGWNLINEKEVRRVLKKMFDRSGGEVS